MPDNPVCDPIACLAELVACPSVNPRGGPALKPPFGEARLNALLSDKLRRLGATVEIHEIEPGRTNLVARFAGRRRDRCLMLESHGDTVPVTGMTIDPFAAQIRGGRLYGRGACDTKGAMAAMLAAIALVIEEDGGPPTDLCFVTTCNEEQGATGARDLMRSGLRADAAVVGEPTALQVVDTHKGVVRFKLTVSGRAAHSSDPSRGINAISKTAAIIRCIDGTLAAELAAQSHPRLGSPVISVGVVNGGFLVNVVPDNCVIEIDRRLLPGETAEKAASQLRRHCDGVGAAEPPLTYDFTETQYYPALESDLQSDCGNIVRDAVQTVLGKFTAAAAPWGSDAGVYQAAGIPSFVFGPGSIQQAHSADEYVALEQVTAAAAVYAEIIRRFH